jgi:signal transduction histidine kinase/DNA-binding response OmpR family regulator
MKYAYIIIFLLGFLLVEAQNQKIDSLQIELTKDIPDSVRLITLFTLTNLYKGDDLDSALSVAKRTYELSKKQESELKIIKCRRLIGDIHRRRGEYKLAKEIFTQNLEEAKQIQNGEMERKSLNDLGLSAKWSGEYEESVSYFLKALDISKEMEDKTSQAIIYANMGLVMLIHKDSIRAINYLQESLQILIDEEDWYHVAVGYLRIAKAYHEWEAFDKALEYEFKALETEKKLNNKNLSGSVNSFIGSTYLKMENYEAATTYLNKALALNIETKDRNGAATCLLKLGEISININDFESGIEYLLQALKIFKESAEMEVLISSYQTLSDAYKKNGNYERAYFYFVEYADLKDSLYLENSSKQIADLEISYGVKEKEAQLELQNTRLARQRAIIIASVLVVFLMLFITFLIYRNALRRKRINEQLEALDQAKSRFFANVSHELRTPLTLILAPLQSLLQKVKNPLQQSELKLIQSNSQKLIRRVNEILSLSKLESGKVELNEEAVNFYSLCKRIFLSYQSLAQFRKVRLDYKYQPEKTLTVLLDVEKFEKVLSNLISNAFTYSYAEGVITLNVNKADDKLYVTVNDTGQGIHTEDLPMIFDRFYQSENNNTTARGGAGIGLALSKEYIRLFSGDISVKSDWGKGSEFTFWLPLKEAKHILKPLTEASDKKISPEEEKVSIKASVLNDNKPLILIVEDDLEMSSYLKQLLSEYYSCIVAPDGKEALSLLEKHRFDLITSDIMMPNMDGFEFRENVRHVAEWKLIPFIMLTARSLEEDKIRSLQLGVDDFLVKPFSIQEFLARIRNLLLNKKEREQWYKNNQDEEMILSAEEKLIRKAENCILENIDQSDYTVGSLASELAYSERQLERLMKKHAGLSPNAFIREIRLQKAYQLLDKRQFLSVQEVCYEVGVENPAYFSKIFIERFGRKPSELLASEKLY